MAFSDEQLNWIYDRTNGKCHICGKQVFFVNYGNPNGKGAWEVEHSVPRAKGGSDYLRNLYPACIKCNRAKSTATTRTARAWHGRTRAPLSKEKREQSKQRNAMAGAGVLGLVGAILAPWTIPGAIIGVAIGGFLGYAIDPED